MYDKVKDNIAAPLQRCLAKQFEIEKAIDADNARLYDMKMAYGDLFKEGAKFHRVTEFNRNDFRRESQKYYTEIQRIARLQRQRQEEHEVIKKTADELTN